MATILLLVQLTLVATFAVAAVSKLADRPATQRTLVELRVPGRLTGPLALAIPLAELVLAAALIPGSTAHWAALAAVGLLAVFTVGASFALLKGRRPDCRCFGALHPSPLGWHTVLRNVGLAGLAGLVAWNPGFEVASLEAIALAAFVAQSWVCYQLLRQNGRVLARVATLETSSPAPVLARGSQAPSFVLGDTAGGSLSLNSLLARGRPVLLLFVKPGCGPCHALLPDVARWQRRPDALTVAVISEEGQPAGERFPADLGLEPELLQTGGQVDALYGISATPSALVIDIDGRIAQPLTIGGPPIVELAANYVGEVEESAAAVAPRAISARAVGAAAGAGVAMAAVAVPSASAADAERQAITALLAKADRKLFADARAIVTAAKQGRKRFPRGRSSLAAQRRAIRKLRTDLRTLRRAVAASPASTTAAVGARRLVVETIQLMEESLAKLDQSGGGSSTRTALKSVKTARKQLDRSLQRSVDAQAALKAP